MAQNQPIPAESIINSNGPTQVADSMPFLVICATWVSEL